MKKILIILLVSIVSLGCSDDNIVGPDIETFKTDSLGVQGNAFLHRIPEDSSRMIIYAVGSVTNFSESLTIEGVIPVLYLYLSNETYLYFVDTSATYEGYLTLTVPSIVYTPNPRVIYKELENGRIEWKSQAYFYINSDTLRYVDFPVNRLRFNTGIRFGAGLDKRIVRWKRQLQEGLLDVEEYNSLIESYKRLMKMKNLMIEGGLLNDSSNQRND